MSNGGEAPMRPADLDYDVGVACEVDIESRSGAELEHVEGFAQRAGAPDSAGPPGLLSEESRRQDLERLSSHEVFTLSEQDPEPAGEADPQPAELYVEVAPFELTPDPEPTRELEPPAEDALDTDADTTASVEVALEWWPYLEAASDPDAELAGDPESDPAEIVDEAAVLDSEDNQPAEPEPAEPAVATQSPVEASPAAVTATRRQRGGLISGLTPQVDRSSLAGKTVENREEVVFSSATRPLSGKLILLAEVDDMIRAIIRHRLERQGASVVETADGMEAVGIIQSDRFDLAVISVSLPGLDGFEVLSWIRDESARRAVPVVMLEWPGDPSVISRAFEIGADDFLHKPFSPVEMVARVKRLVVKRSLSRTDGEPL